MELSEVAIAGMNFPFSPSLRRTEGLSMEASP
jgi:hypothetical protein